MLSIFTVGRAYKRLSNHLKKNMTMNTISDFNFSSKVNALIEVKGLVGEEFTEMFSGIEIKQQIVDGVVLSLIEGEFSDQAEFMGVLNALYSMRFPIIGVELI
jgi:hypothetical protein